MRLDEITREEAKVEKGCHLKTELRDMPTFRTWRDNEESAKKMRKSSKQGRKKTRRAVLHVKLRKCFEDKEVIKCVKCQAR